MIASNLLHDSHISDIHLSMDSTKFPFYFNTEVSILLLICLFTVILLLILQFSGLFTENTYYELRRSNEVRSNILASSSTTYFGSKLWFTKILCSKFDINYDALLTSEYTSVWMRLILLISILGNIAIFIWSDVSIIANIVGTVTVRGTTKDLGTIFDFTLGATVHDMWEAKTYLLAILLALFSGAWPFIKLVTMLFALVLPSNVMSISLRDFILTWMDILGKWSLLDIFFMVILLVAFEFKLNLGKDMEAILYVEPLWGFYSFLLATTLSLILGHYILYIHRRETECLMYNNIFDSRVTSTDGISNVNGNIIDNNTNHEMLYPKEALMNHVFTVHLCLPPPSDSPSNTSDMVSSNNNNLNSTGYYTHKRQVPLHGNPMYGDVDVSSTSESKDLTEHIDKNNHRHLALAVPSSLSPVTRGRDHATASKTTIYIQATVVGKVCMILWLIGTFIVVGYGCIRKTFQFEFKGLAGLLLRDEASTSYSVIGIGVELPDASTTPHNAGIIWIQASFFVFGVIMPLLCLISLLFIWVVPLSLQAHKKSLLIIDIIFAWSALDVFVLAVVASVFEIQQFAAFMIGDACDDINKILEEYFDEVLEGDDVCFDVVATLQQSCWLLFFASVFFAVFGVVMNTIAHTAFKQRFDASSNTGDETDGISRAPLLLTGGEGGGEGGGVRDMTVKEDGGKRDEVGESTTVWQSLQSHVRSDVVNVTLDLDNEDNNRLKQQLLHSYDTSNRKEDVCSNRTDRQGVGLRKVDLDSSYGSRVWHYLDSVLTKFRDWVILKLLDFGFVERIMDVRMKVVNGRGNMPKVLRNN